MDSTRPIARMIASRQSRGHSLAQIAADVHIDANELKQICLQFGLPLRPPSPSAATVRACVRDVMDGDLSISESADLHGLGKTTVHRFVQRHRKKDLDSVGGVAFEEVTSTEKHVCPKHGPVTVWPCVACAALEYRLR